jgi:glycogen synthase
VDLFCPLQEGAENKLVVFMGRITHQKGCDLIGMAATSILKGNKHAQVSA